QHYDYFAPVFVGDKVTCQQKIVDIYDKKGGALWFIVSETAMKNEAGKLVAKATGITVVRNPDAGKKGGGDHDRISPQVLRGQGRRSAEADRPAADIQAP